MITIKSGLTRTAHVREQRRRPTGSAAEGSRCCAHWVEQSKRVRLGGVTRPGRDSECIHSGTSRHTRTSHGSDSEVDQPQQWRHACIPDSRQISRIGGRRESGIPHSKAEVQVPDSAAGRGTEGTPQCKAGAAAGDHTRADNDRPVPRVALRGHGRGAAALGRV